MSSSLCYELIDFGEGRKLESIAGRLIDRPSPAADTFNRRDPNAWSRAQSHFDRQSKQWTHRSPWPDDLSVQCGRFRMPARPTPFGHIGLFPEQSSNWNRLSTPIAPPSDRTAIGEEGEDRPTALNLFGYTGASTVALAVAGFKVAHVDAAKPNVAMARAAAALNGLQDHPIRYLVDDAGKFAAREVRREHRYHTIVLDPPAYGHGSGGKSWRVERDLWPLLDDCLRLLTPDSFRLLVTGHSPQVDQTDVERYLQQHRVFAGPGQWTALRRESGRSQLKDKFGRSLDAGFFVRVEKPPSA